MGRYSNTPADDIARQQYRGPSVAAAAAGEGYIAHFKYAIIGSAVGAMISAIAHVPVHNGLTALRTIGKNMRNANNGVTQFFGNRLSWVVGHGADSMNGLKHGIEASASPEKFDVLLHMEAREKGVGHWLAQKILFLVPKEKKYNLFHHSDRYEAAGIGGGLLGAVGFFIVPFFLAGKGAQKGLIGKRDFDRAKDEIWDLRAENDQLRANNADLKTGAEEQGQLRISQDEPPIVRDEPAAQLPAVQAPDTVNRDSPVAPTPPAYNPTPVQDPVVTDPLTGKKSPVDEVDSPVAPTPPAYNPTPVQDPVVTDPLTKQKSPVDSIDHAAKVESKGAEWGAAMKAQKDALNEQSLTATH